MTLLGNCDICMYVIFQGPSGKDGLSGLAGRPGNKGPPGSSGQSGISGAPGIQVHIQSVGGRVIRDYKCDVLNPTS